MTHTDACDLEDRHATSSRTGTTVTLAYDGVGNRTRKDVTVGGTTTATRYVVDDRTPSGYAQVVEEWQSVNGGAWSLARKYTYGLSRIQQERLSGGAVVGTESAAGRGHRLDGPKLGIQGSGGCAQESAARTHGGG